MIQLNGCRGRWFAGAGSLGFDGLDGGHPPLVQLYKLPFRLAGGLDHRDFVVVSKTVTPEPRAGNQTDWSFWRCARLLSRRQRSMVNAVALSNPGIEGWERRYYRRAMRHGVKLVLSLHVETVQEAEALGRFVGQCCRGLAGVQVNASCPNSQPGHASEPVEDQVSSFLAMVDAFQTHCRLPLLVKYGYYQPWPELCMALEGRLAANELINAVPWGLSGVAGKSPLAGYGYQGAVSGGPVAGLAALAVVRYAFLGLKTPLISGGGVVPHPDPSGKLVSLKEEARARLTLGADAVAFSTAFLWSPAGPNRVVRELDREAAN